MTRLILIVGLCIGILLAFSLYKFKIMKDLDEKEVITDFVDLRTLQSKLVLPAKISYKKIIPLYAQEEGKIYTLFKKGNKVKKGELLAYIEIDALSRLEREKELKNIKEKLKEMKELIENRAKILNDTRTFFEQGVISKNEYEQAVSSYKSAKKEYEEWIDKLKLYHIKFSPANLRIIAPFNGIVYESLVENSSLVSKNTPVFKFADLSEYEIEVKVNEYDLNKCKEAKKIILKSELNPEEIYEATIENISFIPDKENCFTCYLKLLNKKDISMGISYVAEFLGESSKPVLAIPAGAIFKKNGEDIVYLVENNRVKLRKVYTGLSDEEYVEVKEGLRKGDEIIVTSYEELNEGDRIKRLMK